MRIIFMGTPEFAVESLKKLYNDGHDIAGVFTQADKRKNRGLKLSFSPVKELALSHNTPVYQPVTLKDGAAAQIIRDVGCELIVVVAYGKILPKEILDIPSLGCINIHGSVLPKYRGPSPIQHAVINGETETGVTSQFIAEEMDAGDIISIKKILIADNDTSEDLFVKLSFTGAKLLSETVRDLKLGLTNRKPQNHNEATYAPLLTKGMAPINWAKSAHSIKCLVRGLIPWPVATMEFNGTVIKVFSVDPTGNKTDALPGSIVSYGTEGIEVACADGTVIVKEVQAPGGKRMPAADYIRGVRLVVRG